MLHHVGYKTKAIMGLAKAWIESTTEQQRNRFGVAVCSKQIAQRIDGHTKRIDLAMRKVLDARSIDSHKKCVA